MMIRKKLFIAASLSALSITGNAQVKPFTIKGSITEKTRGLIYLQYQNGENKPVLDSTSIEKGTFSFNGSIDGVTEATIMAQRRPTKFEDILPVFLSPGSQTMAITSSDFFNGTLSGTAVAEEMEKLKESKAELPTQFAKMINAYVEADLVLVNAKKIRRMRRQ